MCEYVKYFIMFKDLPVFEVDTIKMILKATFWRRYEYIEVIERFTRILE